LLKKIDYLIIVVDCKPLFFRSVHSQGYNCVTCKKNIKEWRNFQRHITDIHGEAPQVPCSYCKFKSKRKNDLRNHVQRIHGKSLDRVESLLSELLSPFVNEMTNTNDTVECENDLYLNTTCGDNTEPTEQVEDEVVVVEKDEECGQDHDTTSQTSSTASQVSQSRWSGAI